MPITISNEKPKRAHDESATPAAKKPARAAEVLHSKPQPARVEPESARRANTDVPTSDLVADTLTVTRRGRPESSYTPGSAADQIARLDVGDTVALAKRVDEDEPIGKQAEEIYAGMASTLNSAARRVAQQVASWKHKTERGSFRTRDGALMLVVTVTRLA
jgi:hypothetical protein